MGGDFFSKDKKWSGHYGHGLRPINPRGQALPDVHKPRTFRPPTPRQYGFGTGPTSPLPKLETDAEHSEPGPRRPTHRPYKRSAYDITAKKTDPHRNYLVGDCWSRSKSSYNRSTGPQGRSTSYRIAGPRTCRAPAWQTTARPAERQFRTVPATAPLYRRKRG